MDNPDSMVAGGSFNAANSFARSEKHLDDHSDDEHGGSDLARRRRPHLLTETLQENEELASQNYELQAENQRLREKITELNERLKKAEHDLSCMGRTRSARSMGSNSSEKQQSSPQKGVRRLEDMDDTLDIDDLDGPTIGLLSDLEGQEAENLRLQTAVEEALMANKNLEESAKALKQELLEAKTQRVEDENLIQKLFQNVEELEETLSHERDHREAAATEQEEVVAPPAPFAGGAGSLGSELHQSPVIGEKAPVLLGHLQKRAPRSFMGMRSFQRRFVAVENGRMTWWAKATEYPKGVPNGSLDFSINPCVVEADPDSPECFILRPVERVRVSQFTVEAEANGVYNIAEFRSDPSLRYKKEDAGAPMFIFWGDGRWYIAPESNVTSALAVKAGPDTLEGLVSTQKSWVMHKFAEHGQAVVTSESSWVAASFTNAHAGRFLEWSVSGSEHTRNDWLHGLRQQVEQCKHKRVTLSQYTQGVSLAGMLGPMGPGPA